MTTLTKASVYLRPVGSPQSDSNIISSSDGVSIESANFYRLSQGNPNIVFDNTLPNFFGSGYMVVGSLEDDDAEWGCMSYPIKAEVAGAFNLYLRVARFAPYIGNFSFEVLLDGEVIASATPPSDDSWVWKTIEIVIPDNLRHDLSIRVLSENTLINCMHIGNSLPNDISFDAPYVTVHFKSFQLDADYKPSSALPVYDFKTTLKDIEIDDWYNFSLAPLPGHGVVSFDISYSVAMFGVGSSESHHVVWDYSSDTSLEIDPYNPICALIYDSENRRWSTICDRKYSLRLYSFHDSLDKSGCSLVTPAAALDVLAIRKFDTAAYLPAFLYTGVVETGDDTNKVQLQLPDRIVAVLVDQSGSMTWNDSDGLRHDLAQRLVSRVDATYPGSVKWNIFSFQGTPIRLNFFAVVEQDGTNTQDVEEAAATYFADQESGYAGIRVIRKAGSFPNTPVDGEIVTEGFFDRAFDENLEEGREYFYKVFTFNPDGTYSNGVEIQATPRERDIPTGVSPFTANILLGSGIRIDDHVVGSWHLDEAQGSVAYDFTANQIHAFSKRTAVWLNSSDVPVGRSGLRIGQTINNAFQAQDTANKIASQTQYTLMFWIYPLETTGYRSYFAIEDNSNTKANVGIRNGKISFTHNFSNFAESASNIDALAWTHVAVTVNETSGQVLIYVNGELSSTTSLAAPSATVTPYITLGASALGSSLDGFGKVTEFSVHNVVRDASYILQQSNQPETIDDKILDNGDRLLLLNYSIPDGADYLGGHVRVVERMAVGEVKYSYSGDVDTNGQPVKAFEGFGLPPFHPNDGDIIYNNSVFAPGQYSFTVADSFVHGRIYHYKVFSQNLLGNFSNWSDSPVLSVEIPAFSDNSVKNSELRSRAVSVPSLSQISGASVQPGNRKAYLRWTAPTDAEAAQVLVYYSFKKPPIFNEEGTVSEAELIFSGEPDQTSFVHRAIENDVTAYYAIVVADKYGYVSAPTYLQTMPLKDADETGIPLLEISKLRYEIVDESSISLAWEQPVRFQKSVTAYFDQRVAIFAQITDEFGAPLADDSNIKFIAKGSLSSAENAEDVFGDTVDFNASLPSPEDTYLLSSVPLGNGLIKGILRMASDFDVLSAINELRVAVKVFFSIPDRNDSSTNVFEYNSLPITISLHNPFKMELVNQSGDSIKHLCKEEVPLDDPEFLSSGGLSFDPNNEQLFDGTFIRRSRPFVARVKTSYRGESLGAGSQTFVVVKQASDPKCNKDGSTQVFTPSFSVNNSAEVLPPATTIALQVGVAQSDNGSVDRFSYADIPLSPPRTPQAVMLFAQVSYNGFTSRKKMYVVFENILRVEVTPNEPAPDCIEQAEQFAAVYLIDPDSPNVDAPNRIQVPDNQICRWNLRKGISGKDRPFFSLDSVSAGPGVYSFIRSGTARRVFFGPACGVTWQIVDLGPNRGGPALLPEIYAVKASAVYDGLVAFEERPLIIYPGAGRNTFGARFLMNFQDILNTIWADGYDYQRLTIYRDPNSAGGPFGSIFRACAEELNGVLFVMNRGQIIEIETQDDFEIIHGENLEISLDPNIDEFEFSNATTDVGLGVIPLDVGDDETHAYLRINKFIGPKEPPSQNDNNDGPLKNRCSVIEIPQGIREDSTDKIITGRTSVVVNGETRYLSSGGSLINGVPPTVIRMKEPLSIQFIDARINGVPVQKILVDGSTEHTFTLEVSFSGKPVPDGTAVRLTVAGQNPTKIQLRDTLVYTSQREDPYINNGIRSYAQVSILPINPAESFSAEIDAETNYDKRGTVTRKMVACVSITYDSQQQQASASPGDKGEVNNVFSNSLLVYSISGNDWVLKTAMTHARGGLSLTHTTVDGDAVLHAIGGLGDSAVTAYNERYNIADDSWTIMAAMPTPRFNHATALYGGKIYVFGGFVVNNSQIDVTPIVERYDPVNDVWDAVSSMPTIESTSYGVAMAGCVVVGNYAYILSGIRDIDGDGTIRGLNDRVLVYSFVDDTWSYGDPLTGVMLDSYRRIAPFYFYDSSESQIRVTGGAHITGSQSQQSIEFSTDAYAVDASPTIPEVSLSDNSFDSLPIFRYRGGTAVVSTKAYFIGGSNADSDTLKIMESSTTAATSTYARLQDAPTGLQSFGIAPSGGVSTNYIYVCGGITSGRPQGFAQIKASAEPGSMRLDGRQSAGINIELIDEAGKHIESPIRVLVRGYLIFPNASSSGDSNGTDQSQQSSGDSPDRQALVYPVIFSSNDFVITGGIGTTTLLPRSDDILRKISDIKQKLGIRDAVTGEGQEDNAFVIQEGKTRRPYDIRIQITIVDDFYYGQTVVNITDNDSPDQPNQTDQTGNTATGDTSGPTTSGSSAVSGVKCKAYSASKALPAGATGTTDSGAGTAIGRGLAQKSVVFSLNPPQKPQLPSPGVSCFCDIEWLPQVIAHLATNDSSASDALVSLARIRNSIAFGGSPLYDGLSKIAETLIEESGRNFSKIIYANTDNEENLSLTSIDEAIEEIQAIDGFGRSPVIVNNFSVVFPVTLSALVARTDTESLERLANETGGESQTILEASFINDVLNNAIGRVNGSIGWGTYEATIDLGASAVIHSAHLSFELFDNTSGNWSVSVSEDGFVFGEESDIYESDAEPLFSGLFGRYLKFKVTLLSGLSASQIEGYDTTPTPGAPSLTGINIDYSIPAESFIFVNADRPDASAQQIAVGLRSNEPDASTIEVGAATSNSTNWTDYQNGSQPPVGRGGKIFIPIRTQQSDASLNEPLIDIDGFVWKTKYGSWNPESGVIIRDADGNAMDPALYKVFPRQGVITFAEKKVGSLFIDIENAATTRLGIRIVNRDADNPVVIEGFGYFYNTNVFLPPPLAQRPPEASSLSIVPAAPGVYTTLLASYRYFDVNNDVEDVTKTDIRWYVNGVEVPYLRNLRSWNDVTDINDPIWLYAFTFAPSDVPTGTSIEQFARLKKQSLVKVGDVIYFTVRPHDGKSFGSVVRSPSVTVASSPPAISNLVIRGRLTGGATQDNVTTATTAFADYTLVLDDSDSSAAADQSIIIWYVNGVEFKRGKAGESTNGVKNDELLPGELKPGTGTRAIVIGNVLSVEVRPATAQSLGTAITSASKTVENTPPTAANVLVSPPSPTASSDLQVSYDFVDTDVASGTITQNNQSSIRWYRKRGQAAFEEVVSIANRDIVPATLTASGDKWYAEVIPFDGVSVGTVVRSNTVQIS